MDRKRCWNCTLQPVEFMKSETTGADYCCRCGAQQLPFTLIALLSGIWNLDISSASSG